MLTFQVSGGPAIANDLACLNLNVNERGVACIKISRDSEGMYVLYAALDTACEPEAS